METSVFIAKRNIFGYYSSSFAANLLKINANIAKITYPAAMTVRMFFVISTPVDGFTFELSAAMKPRQLSAVSFLLPVIL